MKTLHLLLILLTVIISLGFGLEPVHADDENGISIQNIQVQPTAVKIGNIFTLNATLVNNSSNTVSVGHGACEAPFSVSFDNHVHVTKNNLNCTSQMVLQKLDPGEKILVTSPYIDLVYKAVSDGISNAVVTFSYFKWDATTQSDVEKTISEPFSFTIYENDTITKSLKLGNHPIREILSPLRQFKSGVAANDVICRPDMQLLIQNQENFPICVKLDSVSNLLRQDWSYPVNCKYVHDPFTAGVAGLVIIEKNASDPSSDSSYSPRNSTVVIGWNNTVSWINQDLTPSSVTSNWNLFDSGPILPGNDWKHNFECAGNYGYHSEPHPWMKGWIRVLPPSR